MTQTMTQNQATTFIPPQGEPTITVRDLITVNLALSEVLVEETRLMETMQIGKVGDLQDKKLKLTALMERYTRQLSQRPQILAAITVQERHELQKAGEVFRAAIRHNYDRLLVAREVNGTVVACVKEEISKRASNPVYNAAGNVTRPYRAPISVTLNQTI